MLKSAQVTNDFNELLSSDNNKNFPGKEVSDSKKNIKVFPNPTTGILNICIEEIDDPVKICIFDLQGNMIVQKTIPEHNGQIDLSALSKGVYFVKIYMNGNVVVQKIVLE